VKDEGTITQPVDENETIPFYPDHVRTEAKALIVILLLVIVIGVIGTFIPVGLGPPADPMVTPDHIKPEWYFLFLYELLKYLPKTLGATLPVIGALVLLIWPFLDRRADSRRSRTLRIVLVVVAMAAVIGLTVLGETG
jgi:quinol-cytochrome oxidoreductase complex cytochrome b subunit